MHAQHVRIARPTELGFHMLATFEDHDVLYSEESVWVDATARVRRLRVPVVESHNPYWDAHGITISDPDGYRVVLHRGSWTTTQT